jgi:homoserine O-acetyltransferase/O-succinyltransferase
MTRMQSNARRIVRTGAVALAMIGLAGGTASLAQAPEPVRFDLGDYTLESGEIIEGAFLTYVTHGELNEERDNAILVLPSLMANHTRHDFLIGPGLALDPEHYFIIAANTLGNGQAISPSNSETQPGFDFPQFSIRDMVNAQHQLVTEEFELDGLLAVVGLSMGGMQTYEWAASYPDFMEGIVPIITMGRTTAWVTAIWETHRRAIMADFEAGDNGEPAGDTGFRSAIGGLMVWARHWHWMDEEFAEDNLAVIDWIEDLEENLAAVWSPYNYIYQTRAEDLHDIAEAPGMNGDYDEALRSIQARTLLMPGTYDILHPVDDSRYAAELIPDARLVEIESPIGHLGGGGTLQADVDLMNREIGAFLEELVVARGD